MPKDLAEHIIEACQRKELSAQEQLYTFYVDRLYYTVLRYVSDRYYIENIVQDVFLKIFKHISHYDPSKASFSTWVKVIAIREAINHCKKKSISFSPIEDAGDLSRDDAVATGLAQLKAADILSVIAKIPDKYRIIFNLYEIDGYSHQEIADFLGITDSTSRSYLSRAKSMIQVQLNNFYAYEKVNDEKASE